MSDMTADRPFPRGALIAGGALIALSLTAAIVARYGNIGTTHVPMTQAGVTRTLHFDDRADGAVVVTDDANGREVAVLAPGTNGFIRGVLRGLARQRRAEGISNAAPFNVIQRVDGRLDLADPQTGRDIALNAFGHTQVEAFTLLLKAKD